MKKIKFNSDRFSEKEILEESKKQLSLANNRRSIRDFSDRVVSRKVIENLIMTASSAPSGANLQPWTFCAIGSKEIKSKIREAAEKEEKLSYSGRMNG